VAEGRLGALAGAVLALALQVPILVLGRVGGQSPGHSGARPPPGVTVTANQAAKGLATRLLGFCAAQVQSQGVGGSDRQPLMGSGSAPGDLSLSGLGLRSCGTGERLHGMKTWVVDIATTSWTGSH
jgi:hypothetical protein